MSFENEESEFTFKCPSGEWLTFDHLNPVVFVCVGNGIISKLIQKASDPIPGIPENEIATHVAVGGFDSYLSPVVFESHYNTNGLKKKSFKDFLERNKESKITAYPYPKIDLRIIEVLQELNLGYGTKDILTNQLADWNLDIARMRPDKPGLICSEALARSEPYRFIEYQVASWHEGKKPWPVKSPWLIQPAHYQRLFPQIKTKGVKVQ